MAVALPSVDREIQHKAVTDSMRYVARNCLRLLAGVFMITSTQAND
jgi:hypothetical protein